VWYLEAVLFLSGIVLWAFVFAWQTRYTGRPVFRVKVGVRRWVEATLAGIVCTVILYYIIDPTLRLRMPEEYPGSIWELVAMVMFSLGFGQLFTIFAPFAWLVRLLKNEKAAMTFTVVFGMFLMVAKRQTLHVSLPLNLSVYLAMLTFSSAILSIYFYLRGGLLLAWWFALVMFSRHLVQLAGQ